MKTLTNESKLIFLSQNVGNQVMYEDGIYIFNGICLEEYVIQVDLKDGDTDWWHIDKAKLIKPPLQNISDEHAIEVAKLVWNTPINHRPDAGRDFISHIQEDSESYSIVDCFKVYQYLKSQSYALDYYCPIENRIIPVQEQIDNGWITLKTE